MSAEPSPQSPWQAATITRIEKRTLHRWGMQH